MKKLIVIIGLVFLISDGHSQISIHNEVVTSQGTVETGTYMVLSSTIGESCIATYMDSMVLLEGFEQAVDSAEEPACAGDFNNSGSVNTADLLLFLGGFGCTSACPHDLNGDDVTNTADLLLFLGFFGNSCE
ncbi:MAG: hypothetical protein KDC12_14940 [Flavobacteriales bacterium]|nr:hypothetical protein [Flavobacteriales bacterium]